MAWIELQDLLLSKIDNFGNLNNSQASWETILIDLIESDLVSERRVNLINGENYYNCHADIVNKLRVYMVEENGMTVEKIDTLAVNNIVQRNFLKNIIDQKVGYLCGKPVTINSDDNNNLNDILTVYIDNNFHDLLNTTVRNASYKGSELWQIYVDELGAFKYKLVDQNKNYLCIYNDVDNQVIDFVICYYSLIGDSDLYIEVYDREKVSYYQKYKDPVSNVEKIILDINYDPNPRSHFYFEFNEIINDDITNIGVVNNINLCNPVIENYSWNRVPFIEFRNNYERNSDLNTAKSMIDSYNRISSETADNFSDIQQTAYVVKNYQKDINHSFLTNLKNFKVVNVGDDGGVTPLYTKIDQVDVESRLQRLEKDIYSSMQAVNNSNDIFNNAPSGITLKIMYQELDLKCNIMERRLEKAINEFVSFLTQYLLIVTQNVDLTNEDVNIVFNKTMTVNEMEKIEMINMSGWLSQQTLLENHPFVKDVAEEILRIKNDQQQTSLIQTQTKI